MKIDSGDCTYQSDLIYRTDLDIQKDLIFTFLHGGTLTFVNDAFCRFLGKPCDELIGSNFLSFVRGEDKDTIKKYVLSIKKGGQTETFELQTIGHDGKTYWIQCTVSAHFAHKDGLVEFQCIGYDITRQKQQEEKMRKVI
jgi:PAS domain S-box-containing protein